jgi:uncharacterized protein (TIGR02588 family)
MKNSKQKAGSQERQSDKAAARKPGTSIAEWVIAGISCVGLLSVLAYLVVDGFSAHDGAPEIVVLSVGTTPNNGGYVVEFSASNRGEKSVAEVEIKGELRDGDDVAEESSVILDYLPQKSERRGALIFTADPGSYQLRLFAVGYIEP